MRSRPAAIPQYLKSGRLAMFFLIFCVLFVPVVFSVIWTYVRDECVKLEFPILVSCITDLLMWEVRSQVFELEVTLRLTVGQSVSLGVGHPFGVHDQILLFPFFCRTIALLFILGRPLWRDDGSVICSEIRQWSDSRRTRVSSETNSVRFASPLVTRRDYGGSILCSKLLYDWRSVNKSSLHTSPWCSDPATLPVTYVTLAFKSNFGIGLDMNYVGCMGSNSPKLSGLYSLNYFSRLKLPIVALYCPTTGLLVEALISTLN
jgi:hypothetical protein